uniref:alpha-1,2-Mannosidase n=1 Tax=Megaselia scalaris TaxID=36166 RepID=T1G9Y5_MEGSC
MDALWKLRNRGSDLMGTVLNVNSGDWVRRDSGVGAGIDSYYEYLFKSYILLGNEKYLNRFNRHYDAIMKYISEGPMLLDVLMHRPHAKSRNFMDSLLAFWPGLQVLSGDLKPAVQTHEMLYQVMQMHNFIPEAFTVDFQVHWSQHPLRPEFIESTYFLYKATKDHHYLQVGKKALKALQKYAKVPCGYAAVNDVRTGKHEDHVQETLPSSFYEKSCPSSNSLLPEKIRQPLKNFITGSCPRTSTNKRLRALDFQANSAVHLRAIYDMGITIRDLGDGKAKSPEDGQIGLLFMQEMLELTKFQNQIGQLQVIILKLNDGSSTVLTAGPSHFGKELKDGQFIEGEVEISKPLKCCSNLENAESISQKIVLSERGDCTFVEKARRAEKSGAIGLIICDNNAGTSSDTESMFAMSGDGNNDVTIPVVFIYSKECNILKSNLKPNVKIMQMVDYKKELENNKSIL